MSDFIKLEKKALAPLPAEALSILATTYWAKNKLLLMVAPIGIGFAEEF